MCAHSYEYTHTLMHAHANRDRALVPSSLLTITTAGADESG